MTHAELLARRSWDPGPLEKGGTSGPHLGRALLGSTLGAAAGTGAGVLLLRAATMADPDDDWGDDRYGDPAASDAAATAAMLGLVCILGGAPFGAVRMGRIEQGRTGAYVLAGVGEFVVGALGYVLATRLHESSTSGLVGLGTGVVVGAAGGAVLAASQREPSTGLVGYQSGEWNLSPPDVRLHPNGGGPHPPSVSVSLLALRW